MVRVWCAAHLHGGVLARGPLDFCALCAMQHRLPILLIDVVSLVLHQPGYWGEGIRFPLKNVHVPVWPLPHCRCIYNLNKMNGEDSTEQTSYGLGKLNPFNRLDRNRRPRNRTIKNLPNPNINYNDQTYCSVMHVNSEHRRWIQPEHRSCRRTSTEWGKKGFSLKWKDSLKPPTSSPSSSASGIISDEVMSVRYLSTSSSFSVSCTHKMALKLGFSQLVLLCTLAEQNRMRADHAMLV